MLIIDRYKKHGVMFREVWLATDSANLTGITQYRGCKKPIGKDCKQVRTLVTDLRLTPEELMQKCKSNVRNEIRRAPKEGVGVCMVDNSQVNDQEIGEFLDFFMEFWGTKGGSDETIDKYRKEINELVKNNAFCITKAILNGKPIVYHTYVVGEDFARFYQSASLFRQDNIDAKIVGFANKYLQMEDMLYFKKLGKTIYDWGGAGQRDEVAAITKFKEGFGGDELFYYDGEEVKGFWPSVIKKIIIILSKM